MDARAKSASDADDGQHAGRSGLRLLLLLACALALFAIYYPGTLEPDSTTQLNEAMTGRYTDWHPPIMAAIWRLMLPIAAGAAPFLALHLALYAVGAWAFWDAASANTGWRRLLPLVAAAHPLMLVLVGSVQKDVSLAVSLFAASGLLFRQRSRNRAIGLKWGIPVALLLAYAVLVRWNGVFAVAPLLIYWASPAKLRLLPVMIGTVVLLAASVPVSQLIDHDLLGAGRTYPEASLELFDLAGIANFSGDRHLLPLPRGCYTPFFWDPLNAPRCGQQLQQAIGEAPSNASDQAAGKLTSRWLAAIVKHPAAYAAHRLRYFNSALYFLVPPAERCKAAPDYFNCGASRATLIAADFGKKNPVYWPCVWVAAGLWLLWRTTGDGARVLAWSGVLNAFGYLAVGVATDWRYHLWTILAIGMAVALHFASSRGRQLRGAEFVAVIAAVSIAGYTARLIAVIAG